MPKHATARRWTGWNARKPSLLRPFPVLRCEELEGRFAPATFTWIGLGANNNWSTAANWAGGVPVSGADLSFPAGALQKTNVNNLPAGTTFNSIAFGAGGYTLGGNDIVLGQSSGSGSGTIMVNAGATGNTISFNMTLGAAAGSDQSFTVNAGADLTIGGKLDGTTGSRLTKVGTGKLTLGGDNSGFTGPIKVDNNAGTLVIGHRFALGSAAAETTVGTNSTLAIDSVAGKINEPLRLNGVGTTNNGALLNLTGTNTWAGDIVLDSNAVIGADAGVLDITGEVSDSGAGADLLKEGVAEVRLDSPTGNTYRGVTRVNNGILTAGTGTALGTIANGGAGSKANGTIVSQTLTKAGQLRLRAASGGGFTVVDEVLTLNGNGQPPAPAPTLTNGGAFTNTKGDNTWAGSVFLGSPGTPPTNVTGAAIGAAAGTNLTISGVVDAPDQIDFQLVKVDEGRVILNNRNLYRGLTDVQGGTLTARDSLALGGNLTTAPTGKGTQVADGATLELEVEIATDPLGLRRYDAHGRDLWIDSVTGDADKLLLNELLTIAGRGVGDGGALRSVSGINIYNVNIALGGAAGLDDAIGVDQDVRPGHPTPNASYFVSDYSLTVPSTITGGPTNAFVKLGAGHLILPVANPYLGKTYVEQGWVTIQNDRSLGGRIPGIGDTVQPGTIVSNGAAVHIKPLTAASPPLNLDENITISGLGPAHPYAFLNKKGGLMNLGGLNTWSGDVKFVGLAGIGVEQVDPLSPSELTVTGSTSGIPNTQNINGITATGSSSERSLVIDTGATSGTVSIDYNMYGIPDRLAVFYPTRAQGGTAFIDTGLISGSGTAVGTFGPGATTKIEIVMNPGGGQPGTVWTLSNIAITTTGGDSGLVKLGSKRLVLEGEGTYPGGTDIREGTIQARNDTALGQLSSGTLVSQQTYGSTDTTVRSGATLELNSSVKQFNGGLSTGLGIWNERLTLNSAGQQVAVAGSLLGAPETYTLGFGGSTTADLPVWASAAQVEAALNALPSIHGPEQQTITVGGNPAGTFTVSFRGQTTAPALPVGASASQVQAALNGLATINSSEVQLVTVAGTAGSFRLTFIGQQTAAIPYNATAAAVRGALEVLSNIGVGNVTVTGTPGNYTVTFTGTLALIDLPPMTATGAGGATPTVTTQFDGINGSVLVTAAVGPTNTVYTVTFGGDLDLLNLPTMTAAGQGGATVAVDTLFDGINGYAIVTEAAPGAADPVNYPYGATRFDVTFGGDLAGTGLPVSSSAAFVTLGRAVHVPFSAAKFTLTYPGGGTTAALPITATAKQVQDALNAGGMLPAALQPTTVTRAGNVFTVVFGTALAPDALMLAAAPSAGAEVTVSGGNAPIVALAEDHTWRDGVTFAAGTRASVGVNSRLSLLGPITDASDAITIATSRDGGIFGSEVQTVTNTLTSGTFTLTFDGQSTAPLPYNASAGEVALALNNLPSIIRAGGKVAVTAVIATGNTVYTIAFGARMAMTDQVEFTHDQNGDVVTATATNGAPGTPEVQTLKVLLPAGTFTLTFNGSTTAPLPYNATSAQVEAALNALPSLLGVGGTVGVSLASGVYTVVFGGTLANANVQQITGSIGADFAKRGAGELLLGGANTYAGLTQIDAGIVTAMNNTAFGGTTAGTLVTDGAQLQLQGSLTVAGEPLTLAGSGPGAPPSGLPTRWFQVGPGPINNAQTPNQQPATGRVTGLALDPSDPNVMYIATAGGGAWKTKDAGRTWVQLFDADARLTTGGTVDPNMVIYGGAIAVAPSDPTTIYFATGEESGSADSFAGSGVYKSTDSGRTWTVLVGPGNSNPMQGMAISKVVVDPIDKNLIYVASSDKAVNGYQYGNFQNATDAPGVWRYNGTSWYDLTSEAARSPNRTNPPSVAYGQSPFNAPTSPPNTGGIGPPNNSGPDDDYRITFPHRNASWTDLQMIGTTLYAALGRAPEQAYIWNGNGQTAPSQWAIRNAVYRTPNPQSNNPSWYVGDGGVDSRNSGQYPLGTITATNGPNYNIKFSGSGATIYAVNVNPATYGLLNILKSTNGGATWATSPAPPNYMGTQGWYDTTVVAVNANTVVVGGSTQAFRTTNGGGAWTDISTDANGFGPHADYHASISDAAGNVYVGSDGGVWKLDTAASWTNLNGDLAITTFNGIAVHPTDFNVALGGSQDNGTERFGNDLAWTWVDGGDGGQVRYNQQDPNFAYHVLNGRLQRTTDGGDTWTTVLPNATNGLYFPFEVDPIDGRRVVVSGNNTFVQESINNGDNWVNLNAPFGGAAVALASYQGKFAVDAGFPQVVDKLSNTYDPDTIYVTDGGQIAVTKNHGVTWATRSIPGVNGGITSLAVDPSNRDIVYAAVSRAPGVGGGRVFRTTNAGQTWTNISGNIPLVPTWKVVVDPRSGTIYVGNDKGVWQLRFAGTATAFNWTTVGTGMPQVQVKDLALNTTLNTLTAGSYGRSMFQFFLTEYANAATVSTVQNGGGALKEIQRVDLNLSNGGTFFLSFGAAETAPLPWNADAPQVKAAIEALATLPAGYTVTVVRSVTPGTTSDFRYTVTFNAPAANANLAQMTARVLGTGALREVTGTSSWTGPITLTADTWIGAAGTPQIQNGIANASLNVVGTIGDTPGGGNFKLHKVGFGTVTLAGANTYTGQTLVEEGALRVANAKALGGSAPTGNTVVSDGAALELQSDLEREPVTINGDGIKFPDPLNPGQFIPFNGHATGALRNVSNNNVYTGPLTFGTATPISGSNVTIGVDSGSTLTIGQRPGVLAGTGAIVSDGGSGFQFDKELTGTLVLASADTYGGLTRVVQGALQVQDAGALGASGAGQGTRVLDGAQLQIARNAVTLAGTVVAAEPLFLSGTGIFGTGALSNVRGDNTWAGPVTLTNDANFSPTTIPGDRIAIGVTTAGDNLTVGGVIGFTAGTSFGLIKTGPGRLILTNANLYPGETDVNAGLLQITNPGALGPAVQGTVVAAGAGLELSNAAGMTVAEQLILNGDGVSSAGALNNVLGNNAYGGTIVLGTDTTIAAAANTTLTATGLVQDPFNPFLVPAPRLRKAGTGTVVFPDVKQYSGKTVVDQGVLRVQNAQSLGAGSEVQYLTLTGTSGSFNLAGSGSITRAAATAASLQTALNGVFGVGNVAVTQVGSTDLTNTTLVFGIAFRGALANTNVPTMSVVTGGTLVATVSTAREGVSSEIQKVRVTGTNGTYTLTFRGQSATFNYNDPAATVQAGLAALTSIGVGNVSVSGAVIPGGLEHTVTFTGTLANENVPQMTRTTTGAAVVIVTTLQDGLEGTSVTSGATLQLAGGITMNNEVVTINGNGFSNQGALNSFSGLNTWAAIPLILGSNASVGTTDANPATDKLTFTAPITDNGTARNLDVFDPGTVVFQNNGNNLYTGTTTVRNGVLQLDQPSGLAIRGPLVVGDGTANATVRETQNDQIGDAGSVTVNQSGTFDLNGKTDAIGKLFVNAGGVAQTGANGQLTTADVTVTGGTVNVDAGGQLNAQNVGMTGGIMNVALGGTATTLNVTMNAATINLNAATSTLKLGGDITTLAAATSSTITGPGAIDLNGANRKADVAEGAALDDLVITAQLAATGGGKLLKTGAGRLEFLGTTAFPVTIDVQAGDLQVGAGATPTAVGLVQLDGGSLSGTGTVGGIVGGSGPSANGTVTPGDPGALNPASTLTSNGNLLWGGNTTYAVDLNPLLGSDTLVVNGSVSLSDGTGFAALSGTTAANIPIGTSFVILSATGGITGRFARPAGYGTDVVFLGGQKFAVVYDLVSAINTVTLTKVKADVALAFTLLPIRNPSTLNEPLTYKVHLTPETGTVPTTDQVTFTFTGSPPVTVNVDGSGDATFNVTPTAGGTYSVTAQFLGDATDFNAGAVIPAPDQVVEVPAIAPLTVTSPAAPFVISPNNSPGVRDAIAVTTTVTGERAVGTTWTVNVRDSGNNLVWTRTVAPTISVNTFPVAATWNGKDNVGTVNALGAFVPDGQYTIAATVNDPWNTLTTPAVTVAVDNGSPAPTPLTTLHPVIAPGTASTVFPDTRLTSTVADSSSFTWSMAITRGIIPIRTFTGSGGPGGLIDQLWDGTDAGGVNPVGDGLYTATLTITDTAGNGSAATSTNVVVLKTPPTLAVTSTSTVYGQNMSFTATMSLPSFLPAALVNAVTGQLISFYKDGNPIAFGTAALGAFTPAGGQYRATAVLSGVPTFNAGDASITTSFAGTTNFLPAASAARTHTVTPALLTVTANPQTKVYGDALPPLTFGTTGLVNGDTVGVVLTGALSTTATASSSVGVYPINQGTLALTTANYTLSFFGNTLTVGAAPLTVTANPQTKFYGAAVPTLTFGTTGLVNGDTPGTVFTGALGTTALASSPVGNYPITQGTLSVSGNYALTFVGNALSITPVTLSVSANAKTKLYGAVLPALTYTATGLVNGDTPGNVFTGSLTTTATQSSVVGSYPITRGTLAANANYVFTNANFTASTLTVTPAPLTVTANPQTKVYGAALPTLTYSTAGLVNNDSDTAVLTGALATTATAASGVGAYPITQGTLLANANYALTVRVNTLTVTPAGLTVTADPRTKVYGDAVPTLTRQVSGLVNGDLEGAVLTGSLATTASASSAVGTYPITSGTLALLTANYTLNFTGNTLTVTPATLIIAADAKSKLYGAAVPTLTYSVNGLVNGDQQNVVLGGVLATTATASSPVIVGGSYPITQGTLSANANYTIGFTGNTLTVTPAPVSVAADPKSKVYGAALPQLTFTTFGLVNGDVPSAVFSGSLATTATQSSAVNAYPITRGTLTANANYTLTGFTPSNLTVIPAQLTVTATSLSKVYGAALPTLTYSVSGLVNGDLLGTVTGSPTTAATKGSSVGQFPITKGSVTATANYTIAFTDGTLSVTPAPLTVRADDKTRGVNDPNPPFTATYTGLVNGDTSAVVGGVNLFTTAAVGTPAGVYPIATTTAPTAQNYSVGFVAGQLTITAVPPVVVPPAGTGGGGGSSSSITVRPLDNLAVGSGTTPIGANVYTPTGQFRQTIPSPAPTARGVRTATADFTGDGIPDVAVGTGPGVTAQVQVIDGASGGLLFQTFPFETFGGGVFLAAGDINGDGKADLVISPDLGGGPRVTIVAGGSFTLMANWFGIQDPDFRGGARAGVGDVDGDGFADVIVSAGFSGGPRVSLWDGKSLSRAAYRNMIGDFFIFEPGLRNGAYVTLGDVNGDGMADLIAGAGPGGGPRVRVLDGKSLLSLGGGATSIADFFAGNVNNRSGVRIATKNLDGDPYSELVVGDGEGAGNRVTVYKGQPLASGLKDIMLSFDAFPGLTDGVFVG